jgi:microcystin-dependent protein
VSEIRIFPWDVVPGGWAQCRGQALSPRDYRDLFAAIGTTYGGDGEIAFNLPDLQGRAAVGPGDREIGLGAKGGQETHTLTPAQMPLHTHLGQASPERMSDTSVAAGHVLCGEPDWVVSQNRTPIDRRSLVAAGGGQPHDNMAPFLALNFCIALTGAAR